MDRGAPPILVLVEPRDIVNIASAVRVAKNFGIESIRLVRPAVFDPWRIEGIAHNSADMIERIVMADSLEEALADTVFSAALTARQRSAKRRTIRPRAMAEELGARGREGPVALVAGREDAGLTNAELDCCHVLVNIPTNPGYRSLNLAQAVAIACYEAWVDRTTGGQQTAPPCDRECDHGTARADLPGLGTCSLGHRVLQDPAARPCHAIGAGDRLPRGARWPGGGPASRDADRAGPVSRTGRGSRGRASRRAGHGGYSRSLTMG